MSFRTLYLQAEAAHVERGSVASEILCKQFQSCSSRSLVGRRIVPRGTNGITNGLDDSLELHEDQVTNLNPNVIYMEGGLFADDRGTWKMCWPILENLVESGTVLLVADCGTREICSHRAHYKQAARFLGARLRLPRSASGMGSESGIAGQADQEFLCDAKRMVPSAWLGPSLSGIGEILIGNPARLGSWEEVAATLNAEQSRIVRHREAENADGEEPWVIASVAQRGFGFVVLIAAEISADEWVKRNPANASWLIQLSGLLVEEAEHNRVRAASSAALPYSLFLSRRSVNRQLAHRVGEALRGFGAQIRLDTEHPAPTDSRVQETGRGMERMSHFVLFWSRACLGAPWVERELPAAIMMAVERRLPVLVVRLDLTPVPKVISDAFRIEGLGMSPQELAANLIQAVRRMERNIG